MRGTQIAAFVLSFSLAIGMLGGLGWFGHVGVQPDPGIDNEEVVEEEAEEVSASGEGSNEDSMFGTISAVMSVMSALWTLTIQTGSALKNLGVPGPIANAIHGIVLFAVLMTMMQIIRGIRF